MEKMIKERLRSIEAENALTILYACESGSRGWGFPSPDSDYDVRFIYIRPSRYYLSVQEIRSDLCFPIDDSLDLYGWDLRKVLQLIRKSNTTPFEWLQSPIVYSEQPGFRKMAWELCEHYFGQRANIHHYLGIAKGALDSLDAENMIKIKKLFYVLRPLLASKWCLERNSIAPMEIDPLMDLMPEALRLELAELISLKATLDEGYRITVSKSMLDFIRSEYDRISDATSPLPRQSFSAGKLDEFFIEAIRFYDNQGNQKP